jgi:hypothetical protein
MINDGDARPEKPPGPAFMNSESARETAFD